MKTILIVVAGMADLPEPLTRRDTPLTAAHLPSLQILAQSGALTTMPTLLPNDEVSHSNALLSLLGYDLARGVPSVKELMHFGLDATDSLENYPTLRHFVIPGFSSHGVCITPSAWVRGAGKCALLRPLDIYTPGSSDIEILDSIATMATKAIEKEEFVFIYVDTPLRSSLRGDYEGKVRALELIDRHLINPIADYVWKSEMLLQLAVTTDLVTPWHRHAPALLPVPVLIYFNNRDLGEEGTFSFTEVEAMLQEKFLLEPSDLMRYLCNFNVTEEEI